MTGKQHVIVSIFFIILLQQAPVDMYLPSLPSMVTYFSTSSEMIQETLVLYLFGFGVSPLVWGPLSDMHGRKKILLLALVIFTLASLGCALTNSIYWLLFFRVLAGIAGGGLQISSSAMARDIENEKAYFVLSCYMSLMWATVPIVAPLVGGYLQTYLGWRSHFYLIFLCSLGVLYYTLYLLPETSTTRTTLSRDALRYRLRQLFSNTRFIVYTLITAFSASITIAFCTAAPFLLQKQMGLNPITFGWLMFLVAGGYLFGVLVNRFLLNFIRIEHIIRGGLLSSGIAAVLMLILTGLQEPSLLSVIGPVFILISSQGFIFSNATSLAMNHITGDFGLSSSLLSSCQMMVIVFVSQFVAVLSSTPLSFAILMLVIATILITLYFILAHFFGSRTA